jgi:hypothetical protein
MDDDLLAQRSRDDVGEAGERSKDALGDQRAQRLE